MARRWSRMGVEGSADHLCDLVRRCVEHVLIGRPAGFLASSPCSHGPCSSCYVWLPAHSTSPIKNSPSRHSWTTLRLPADVPCPAPWSPDRRIRTPRPCRNLSHLKNVTANLPGFDDTIVNYMQGSPTASAGIGLRSSCAILPGLFWLIATEPSRIAAVSIREDPMRARRFFRKGIGHRTGNGPMASSFDLQIRFVRARHLQASCNLWLSARSVNSPDILIDRTEALSCARPAVSIYFPAHWVRIASCPVGHATVPKQEVGPQVLRVESRRVFRSSPIRMQISRWA